VKRHKGNGTGSDAQPPGRRRGPETGNGYTASTGRGRVDKITYQGSTPGQKSRLRIIADVLTRKNKGK
jgi:hypothetical protein